MRKPFLIFLILLLILVPTLSHAAQVPLEIQGRSVYIPDETQIELVSYNAFLRIRTGFSSGNTSMVIRNKNSNEPVKFQMGMPVQIDSISNIKDLSVVSDGKGIKVIQRNTLNNPPSDKEVDVKTWYVWDVSMEPGETKLIESSFAFDNKLELDGTELISFPLTFLENWSGGIKNLQVVADLDFYPPYAFDPMPSISPVQYDNDGRLTFRFNNIHSLPGNLDLSFKPIDVVISKYINANSESNKDIDEILDTYKNKSYDKTILLIDEFLSSEEVLMVNEMKYIKGLCYQSLYDLDKALTLFNELETNPGFGQVLSRTIKNKIIYDKFSLIKAQSDGDEEALEYLISKQDSITNNDIFASWIEREVILLTPPIIEEISEEETSEPEEEEEVIDDESETMDKVSIGKYEFFIEEIVIVLLVLLVLIFIISRIIKRKRRRRRSSIFRY
ncbi:MAG TPA: hypothetical protein VFD57_06730 [Clostridia bacterium]|nr:hypothetical protein [Clostridia bacterium]